MISFFARQPLYPLYGDHNFAKMKINEEAAFFFTVLESVWELQPVGFFCNRYERNSSMLLKLSVTLHVYSSHCKVDWLSLIMEFACVGSCP